MVRVLFRVVLFFYPDLSQRILGMFDCIEIGNAFYLTQDKSQYCYKGTWLQYVTMTMALIAVWVAGTSYCSLFILLSVVIH